MITTMADPTGRDSSRVRPLVIGVGNPDGGDDGIGPAVVEHLRRRRDDLDTVIVTGDLTVLPLLWRDRDDVVVVDACRTGRSPGSVVTLDPADLEADDALSSHGVGVGYAIALGGRLGWLPRRLRVVGIEVGDVMAGPLGDRLARQVGTLAGRLVPLVSEGQGPSSLFR